ncbi:MAG: DUF5916 domain-containing protein [Vicinamibacterales bacterium]
MPLVVFLLLLVCSASPAAAQDSSIPLAKPPGAAPSGPVAPEVVTRDAHGNATIRATRLTGPLILDGRLDDEVYRSTRFISDFVQQEPFEGKAATERTDVWVFVDADSVYISARNWETNSKRRVMSDMQRDARNLYNNDHFGVIFDTFLDRRSGYYFYANAQGGMHDGQLGNDSPNTNWNGLWEVRTANFDGGWTIEFKFPYRSMRFDQSGTAWGINFRRVVRWKNEVSFLTPIPQSIGRMGLQRVSLAGTVVGLDPPRGLRNIDVKPYMVGSRLTNLAVNPAVTGHQDADVGVDVKWGVSQNLVADLTYNTDFAQVEDDEAQVNLTRFSVFFPEKREFFLEGQDYFNFGSSGGFGGGGGGGAFGPSSAPVLFYSRRIGLASGLAVPIVGGGRLLQRAGGFQVGALQIRTGESASADARPTDYSVLRISRNLLSRSRIGLLATRRGVPALGSAATNYAYGADLALNLTTAFSASAYWAATRDDDAKSDASSYRGRLDYNSDRFGFSAEHLLVGANFNPEVGFLRRTAFRRSFSEGRYSPRPAHLGPVRKIYFESKIDFYADPTGALESRALEGTFRLEFKNTDRVSVQVIDSTEQLDANVNLGVTVPAGRYDFRQARVFYELSPSRPLSGFLSVAHGGFYGGTITEASWRGRVELSSRFFVEPTLSVNRLRTPFGNSNSNLFGGRTTFTLTPRMFVSALVQYRADSRTMTTNARFRWEYAPGSDLFLVYSDGRSASEGRFPSTLENRSLIVKATRLFRW